ncbi:MAG: TetR/AcrR family transcriptional regulator [Rhodoplanes sp.]|uniref:TetR/AcrR family transcriptional regulator n=1 Tax=Rhodoplanes sp. TaxID=1968906 RepID=UPI001850CB3C|nr:TetR/AcrR family transcriptional regulator [Rhodoplanes sp.]NVO13650.1 TetR/AcrR family transcriptional regulator [Rhodoplanes sp.]
MAATETATPSVSIAVPPTSAPPASLSPPSPAHRNGRAEKTAARRDAILRAALDEFSERGFASARLDDVARRAGIAKGTIYLYFRDKEALFQDLIIAMLGPLIAEMKALPTHDVPARVALERLLGVFATEVYGTPRRHVLRLVMNEGPRFPRLAEFHYRNVVEPAIAAIRTLLARAVERGELRHRALVDYPQLVVAPGLLSVIWSGMFDRFVHIDLETMLRAYLDILFDGGERS